VLEERVQRRAHFLARSGEAAGGVEQGGGNLGQLTSFGVSLCRHRTISTELSEKRGLARLVSISSRLFGYLRAKETSDAHVHPRASDSRGRSRAFDSPYRASAGTYHAPGQALGNGDRHLTTARWHDAAHYETT
jgi:hypothetical protein